MNNKPDIAIKIDELNDSGILSTIILDTGFDLHTLDRKNAIYLVDSPTNAPIEEGTFLCKSYAKDNNTMVLEVSIVSSTSSNAWTKVLLDGVWGEWRVATSNVTSTENGKQVELQKNDTHIQWKYTDEDEWKDLISIEELKGQQGNDGVNGRDGRDGRDIVLKKSNTHIQWKYSLEDEQYWRDLVELSELKGDRGESADTSQFYTKEEIDEKNGQLAEKTHTHTKEEISNFPTSLPANGGNADTVGGMSADSFLIKTNPNVEGDITLNGSKKVKWNAGREGESEIFWNANSGADLGLTFSVDGQQQMILEKNKFPRFNIDGEWKEIGTKTEEDNGAMYSSREVVQHRITPLGFEVNMPSNEYVTSGSSKTPYYYYLGYWAPKYDGTVCVKFKIAKNNPSTDCKTTVYLGTINKADGIIQYISSINNKYNFDYMGTPLGSKIEHKNFVNNYLNYYGYLYSDEPNEKLLTYVVKVKRNNPVFFFADNANYNGNSGLGVKVKEVSVFYEVINRKESAQ